MPQTNFQQAFDMMVLGTPGYASSWSDLACEIPSAPASGDHLHHKSDDIILKLCVLKIMLEISNQIAIAIPFRIII